VAITFVNASAVIGGTNTASPAIPTGAAAGDLLAACLVSKPDTLVPTTPSGWTSRTAITMSGGTAGASGSTGVSDAGPIRLTLFIREMVGGDTAPSIAITGSAGFVAFMVAFHKDSGTWSYGASNSGGQDNDGVAASYSVTGTSETFLVGDVILSVDGINTDSPTVQSRSLTIPGATGTLTNRAGSGATQGDDNRINIDTFEVTTGATGAPTKAIAWSVSTNPEGASGFLRIRAASSAVSLAVVTVTSAEAAQVVTKAKRRATGTVTSLHAAQALTRAKARAAGTAAESETAQPVARAKVRIVGTATSAETAQTLTPHVSSVTVIPVGTAISVESAHADAAFWDVFWPADGAWLSSTSFIRPLKSRALGTVTETDAAQALHRTKARSAATVTESTAAQALARSKARTVGTSAESDIASPLGVNGQVRVTVGTAIETAAAQTVARVKAKAVGTASETDAALPVTAHTVRVVAVGTALSSEAARPVVGMKRHALGTATETDIARPVTSDHIVIRRLVIGRPYLPDLTSTPAVPSLTGRVLVGALVGGPSVPVLIGSPYVEDVT
jgi:hypothetical protein